MTPALPPETLHLPLPDGPFRMAMALVSCAPADWIEIDDRYPDEMAERRTLLATRHAEVFAALPSSSAARAETLALLSDHLATHHPAWFPRDGDTLHNRLTDEAWSLHDPPLDPLDLAGRLVQEDLCLIRPDAAGPVLEAAVLCAPSRWVLAEKIGHPLLAVHGPVPFYADRLGRAVDRFMGALRPGRIALRMNWSISDDPALFQPRRRPLAAPVTAATAGEQLFLRTERQTFRLLPESGRVVFGIRVHSTPLARLRSVPGAVARLAAAVRALPEEIVAYKGLGAARAALLGWAEGGA